MKINEIEEAIKIVGPLAVMVGLTEEDTKNIIIFVDKMSERGISGAQAGIALRVWLKQKHGIK